MTPDTPAKPPIPGTSFPTGTPTPVTSTSVKKEEDKKTPEKESETKAPSPADIEKAEENVRKCQDKLTTANTDAVKAHDELMTAQRELERLKAS